MSHDALRSEPETHELPGESDALASEAGVAVVPDALRRLHTVAAVRAMDARAIDDLGIPGIVLMRRAAAAAFDALRRRWPAARSVSVLCGKGNNAGDGYVLAGIAASRGLAVQLVEAADPTGLGPDAARARSWCLGEGVEPVGLAAATTLTGDVVVDALLGIGVSGAPRGGIAEAIALVERTDRPVLALDVPSGLDADRGTAAGAVVRARATVTFIAGKRGLFTGVGPDCTGDVELALLDIPEPLHEDAAPGVVDLLRLGRGVCALPRRAAHAHKGRFGHLLVIGGASGFGGAAILASEAALRTGAGLVTVATAAEHVAPLLARRPEVMARGVSTRAEVMTLLEAADAVVVGPGLGQGPWGEAMLDAVLSHAPERRLPVLFDADALNQIAARGLAAEGFPQVRTPHPGEAARLLGSSIAEVEGDRFAAVASLAAGEGTTAVLKGAGSLVADAAGIACCPYGNPGMATAGCGDVLSGVIGALLAGGLAPANAARLGVCLHAAAGDVAARRVGQAGLVAGDLASALPRLVDAVTDAVESDPVEPDAVEP